MKGKGSGRTRGEGRGMSEGERRESGREGERKKREDIMICYRAFLCE